MNNAIQWITVEKTYCAIHRIAIYPVDSVIQPLNNRDLMSNWYEVNFFPRAPTRGKTIRWGRIARVFLALLCEWIFGVIITLWSKGHHGWTLIVCFSFQKLACHAKDLKTEYLDILKKFPKILNVAVLYFPFVFLDKCSSRRDEQRRIKIWYLVYRLHHTTHRFKLEQNL